MRGAALLGGVAVALGASAVAVHPAAALGIALGIAAILLVPSVVFIADEAEGWGRDCALNPAHDPNC